MREPGSGREKPRALFVYGTLREGAGGPRPARDPLERAARKVDEGAIDARLFDAGGFPAAVREPGGQVRGELYELADPARTLSVLDGYEGCRPDGTGLFRREIVSVALDSGGEREAWAYLYNRDVTDLPEIPSGDYAIHQERRTGEGGEDGETEGT